jgi:hypothetical protein
LERDALSRIIDRRIELAREWDHLVVQARQLGPGFAEFLAPPSAESLRLAVADGTAVLVNVTERRSDALVVTAGGIRSVPLPLTVGEAADLANRHMRRLIDLDRAVAELNFARERVARRDDGPAFHLHHVAVMAVQDAQDHLDRDLITTLGRLWDTVAEPVLNTLPAGARIWWCPTGAVNFLPLHAAGRHDLPGASVLDQSVSSYTPTVRALARARHRPEDTGAEPGRMLVVVVPEAPGGPMLPQATEEAELLREVIPAERLTVLEGSRATREAVLEALPEHRWVHFGCHGTPDYEDPSRAGLLLHDGLLTVADIERRRYYGDFAFLSACHTASGGARLPDEVITLAAGLHHTGFRHVLATLWSVDSDVALSVARTVIAGLTRTGHFETTAVAAVLRTAVLERRAAEPDRPSRWALFTHTGN